MLCIILFKTNGAQITNSVLCPVGTNEEKKLGDEQVGPQVAVDRAVVSLPGRPLTAEGDNAGSQTHQCNRDADPRNHKDQQLLHAGTKLERKKGKSS